MNVVRHEAVRNDCTGEASGLFQKMRPDRRDEICIDEERTAIQRAERDEIAMPTDVAEGAESLRVCHVGRVVQHRRRASSRCAAPLKRCPTPAPLKAAPLPPPDAGTAKAGALRSPRLSG